MCYFVPLYLENVFSLGKLSQTMILFSDWKIFPNCEKFQSKSVQNVTHSGNNATWWNILRPCLPDEVPTDVDAEVNAYVEQATSAAWRSHDQANVMCPQNVLHHPRERLQRAFYTPSSKHSSSSCSIAKNMLNAGKHKIITHHDVKFGKGMWHMVHLWGNDYSKANSLPPNPPLFFPCFESVNDRVNGNPRLLFTNARKKKVPYPGKVQDRDFQLGTEIFDDGVKQRDRGTAAGTHDPGLRGTFTGSCGITDFYSIRLYGFMGNHRLLTSDFTGLLGISDSYKLSDFTGLRNMSN
eukprot:g22795.t1